MVEQKNFPLICAPITGKTDEKILAETKEISRLEPDVIEWRLDFYKDINKTQKVLDLLKEMREITNIPFLFTIRSVREGGEDISLNEAEKVRLMTEVCKHADIQYLDYETNNEDVHLEKLREISKAQQIKLILSYHNFEETPDTEKLMGIANEACHKGADIIKFAVMPQSKADVYQLLNFTQTLANDVEVPVISMSMGELGALSRVIGWAFGSVLTFGVGVKSSAPGQVSVTDLRKAIQATQSLTGDWRLER